MQRSIRIRELSTTWYNLQVSQKSYLRLVCHQQHIGYAARERESFNEKKFRRLNFRPLLRKAKKAKIFPWPKYPAIRYKRDTENHQDSHNTQYNTMQVLTTVIVSIQRNAQCITAILLITRGQTLIVLSNTSGKLYTRNTASFMSKKQKGGGGALTWWGPSDSILRYNYVQH